MGNNNLKRKVSILLYLAFLLVSCVAKQKISTSGVVVNSLKFYDPEIKEYIEQPTYWPGNRIWFKDSMVIEEISGLYINRDTNGHETRLVKTEYYTFIDMPSKTFYDYDVFSDTAKLIKKYIQNDSTPVFGGWNFYVAHKWPRTESPSPLSDTVINNITYKRLRLVNEIHKNNGKFDQIFIAYLCCDKKNTMFMFDKDLSKKMGCPIVRVDELSSETQSNQRSSQIEFIRNKLTSEELKVINAWGIKAKKNLALKN